MDPVGRTWYVKITRGMVGGSFEIGTHHLQHGTQVWHRAAWEAPVDPMSERDVVDELLVALLEFLDEKGL